MPRPKGIPKTGGRRKGQPNKLTADVKAIAQQYTRQSLNVLIAISTDAQAPPAARIAAARELLDRGHGRPPQTQEVTGLSGGPIVFTWLPAQS